MNMHTYPGNDWAQIGKLLTGRTANAIARKYSAIKLRSHQAPLPDTSIELLEYKNRGKVICKGDTIVISNMRKSNYLFANKPAVVKHIVHECSEKDVPIVFMVELLDRQLFPVITKANRQRANRNK